MIDPGKFNDWLAQQDAEKARAASLSAPEVAPEQMGRALSLSQKAGVPAGVVAANLPDYEAQAHLDDVAKASSESSAFSRWIVRPEYAPLAKGEAGKLGALARALETVNRPLFGVPDALVGAVERGLRRAHLGQAFQQADVSMFATTAQSAADVLDMPFQNLRSLFASPEFDPLRTREAGQQAAAVAAEARADQQAGMQAVGARPGAGDVLRDPLGALEQGAAYFGVRGAASAPAMTFLAATRDPKAAALLMGAPTGAQTYSDLVAEGVSRPEAAQAALLTGSAEVLGERVGLEALLTRPIRSAFTRGVATEAGQEALTQAMQDEVESQATGRPLSLQERLSNVLDAGALGGLFGAGVAGARAGVSAASDMRHPVQELAELSASVEGARTLDGVVQQVADLTLGKHAPDALRDLVAEAAPDGNVYLAPEAARTLFQSSAVTADAFLGDLLGSPDVLREAEATGSDVVIPMATFVAKLATLPNATDIAKHARLSPEHLSRAELENEAGVDEKLAAIFGDTADRANPEVGKTDTSEQVKQDVLAQLLATDRYTPADAELQANLWGRVFGRMAERTGQDAFDLYNRYQVRINGPAEPEPAKPSLMQRATRSLMQLAKRPFAPVNGTDPVLAGLTLLAQNDAAFQLPVSDAKTVEGVFADLEGERGVRVIRDEFTDAYAEENGADRAWMIRMPNGKGGTIFEQADAVWIDVSGLAQGEDGKRVYNAVANYAFNTGKTFIGDPAGLSDVAQARRLENMISSALKFGTTRHLFPHEKQLSANAKSLVPAIDWKDGNDTHNLRQMAAASLTSLEAQFDGIVNLRYDPTHDEIRDISTGQAFDRGAIEDIARGARKNAAGADGARAVAPAITGGRTSIERAVLIASLLRGSRQEQSAILARLGEQRSSRLSRILYQPDGAGAPRGRLRIGPNRSMAIDLFRGADLSTFIHESAHFFLEVMQDVADTSPEVLADLDVLRQAVGNDGGAFTEDQHEQFARSFEAYIREGKAPSPELRTAFARMRAWLLSVYRDLRQLNVTLTPEVRGVFDRMLATDAEIEAAQAKQGMEPISLTNEARALLTPGQWEAYVAATAEATEEARQDVLQQLLKAHKREAEAWYREQKAAVRAEVEAEFESAPVVRAWRVLSGRDAENQPEALRGLKLDRRALVDAYGEQWVKDKLLRLGVYRKEGGAHPDTAAAALGFDSGDALVKALAAVRDLQARVSDEVDARMDRLHPDPARDGSLPDRAMQAVHNNKRVAALEAEQAILAKLANQPAPPARLVREYARRKIAALTVRSIRPNDYLTAERRAARLVAKEAAAGNYAEALQHKRAQAVQAALYSEARQAQDRAERQIKALRKAGADKTRERIGKAGKSYVEALDALLDGHELSQVSGREVARRASLREWVAKMQAADNHTAVSEELLARVEAERVTNVADLTVQQLADLHEAVQNLLHLAATKNRLQTARGKIEWADAKAELVARLEVEPGRGRSGIGPADKSLLEGLGDLAASAGNWLLQPETIIEWADGGTEGPFHDLLWEPSEGAEHKRESLQRMVGAKLKTAFDALSKEDRASLQQKVHIASLGASVSRQSILSALLNMGNASNRDKLLRGGRVVNDEIVPFTEPQLAEMFSHLTGGQAKLAQGIWDAVNSLWPEIVAMEEELNGFAPAKVEAQAFTVVTRDGPVALQGGYFPAAYDPKGAKVGRLAEDEQAKRILAGQVPIKAGTSKGHLEQRTDFVAPLLLDYGAVLSRHLDGVMGDIAYRQFLKQAYRVLDDADIARRLDNRVGPGATKALKQGFERGAVGSYSLAGPLFGPFQGIADATMTNAAAAALGLRIPLAFANIVTAPILATARVSKRALVKGFTAYYRNPWEATAQIQRLSPMMARRAEGRSIELQTILSSMRGKRGVRARMIEFTMEVHQWIVPLAENAIWLSAYLQAQSQGADMAESVRMADKAIRQTQTKHTAKDLSQVEGKAALRWAMMFAGPMVVINNRLQESGLRGFRGAVETPAQALATWVAMAAGGTWLFELMMGRGPGDDDDDGLDLSDWATWCARKLGLLPFGAIPILRDAADYLDKGFSRSNPLVEAANSLSRFGETAIEQADNLFTGDEEVDTDKLTKSAIRATGVVTGLPTNQAVRTGTYLMEVATGQHTPQDPAKDAMYLLQGPPKD